MRQAATYDRPNEASKTLTLHTNVDLLARPSTRSHYSVESFEIRATELKCFKKWDKKIKKQNKTAGFRTFFLFFFCYQEEPMFLPMHLLHADAQFKTSLPYYMRNESRRFNPEGAGDMKGSFLGDSQWIRKQGLSRGCSCVKTGGCMTTMPLCSYNWL